MRPPITAGPIERAFRLLKSTSVSCGVPEEGIGVTDADIAGVVATGAAAGDAAVPGEEAGGDSSCAKEIVLIKRAEIKAIRVLIGSERNDDDLRLKGKRIARDLL